MVAAACGGVLFLSRYVRPVHALREFPTLAESSEGLSLKGTGVYYDGQMDDARFNVGLACTAAMAGYYFFFFYAIFSFSFYLFHLAFLGSQFFRSLSPALVSLYLYLTLPLAIFRTVSLVFSSPSILSRALPLCLPLFM